MRTPDIAVILTVTSFTWLAVTVIWGGYHYANYDHISQYMSELGATGAPYGPLVNLVGFMGTEILLLAALGLAFTRLSKTTFNQIGFIFLLAYPILIGVTAIFPCDFECRPDDPTLSHLVHIISGLCAYVSAVIGLVLLSRQSQSPTPSIGLKTVGLIMIPVFLFLLSNIATDNPFVGGFQRITETLIYGMIVYWLLTLPSNLERQV